MNLDDLKVRMADQDAKLDRVVRLHAEGVRNLQLSRAESSLRWLVPGVVFELVMAIVAVVWLGDFVFEHLRQPRFLLPAIVVDIGVIALMGSCIRQLVVIAGLDYSHPVVTVQKTLGSLRVLRIRTSKWTMVLSCVLWFPVLVVLLEGFLGVDLWLILGAIREREETFFAWIAANVLFGVVAAIGMIWVAKLLAGRVDRSPAIKRFFDDIAGQSLTKAQGFVDSLARFETEPNGSSGERAAE